MRALVLAGGLGTRLGPWTPVLPKPWAPVANRPVLAWVLDRLDAAGVEQVGVIVPAGSVGLYEKGFGQHTGAGVPVSWLAEEEPVGTGGALRRQAGFFGGEPVLVVPADIVSSVDLPGLMDHHRRHRPAVTVAAAIRDLSVWDGDILIPDEERPGRAAAYLFKPGAGAASRLGSTGAWVVDPAVLEQIPARGVCDFSSQVLPFLPGPGQPLGLFDTGDIYLRDVGTPASLLAANLDAALGLTPLPLPGTQLRPGILAGPGSEIETGAVVEGPVLLGAGSRICAGARVRGPAVIGPEVEVGPGAHVENAVLLPGALMPPDGRGTGEVSGEVSGEAGRALEVLLARAPFGVGR